VTPIELPRETHLPHGLQLLPAIGGHDGFYYALLQKPPH
jgi:16S rRNA C967 or C1407 C5-methylase (RsmB/RsmF family)